MLLRRYVLVASIVIPIALLGVWFVATQSFESWDFRSNLWGPSHLLVTGRDPYRVKQLFPDANAIWLPPSIGAFFYLGVLPERVATNIWALASLCMYLFTIVIVVRRHVLKPLVFGSVLLTTLLFPPLASHLVLGQYSILIMVVLLGCFWRRLPTRPLVAGMICAVTLGKPQLAIVPLAGYVWLLLRRGLWRDLRRFGLGLILGVFALTIPFWFLYPNWIDGLVEGFARNPSWQHPTLFMILQQIGGLIGTLAAGALAFFAFAYSLYRWQHQPETAIAWSTALSLLIVPYVWSWDFVLLIPLFVLQLMNARSVRPLTVLLCGYLVIWAGYLFLRLTTEGNDARFWWVPAAWIAVVMIAESVSMRERGAHVESELSSVVQSY